MKPKPFATEAAPSTRVTADDIVAMLEARHSPDKAVFVAECKLGPSGARRLDGWALLKTWSPPTTIGYEVKVSRSDFLNDRKWETYLPVCNEFYFACPSRLIAPEELPSAVGLLWTAGGRLLTKRKASRREVDHEKFIDLVTYVLMSRTRIVGDMWAAQRQPTVDYWRAFVADREAELSLGHIASQRVRRLVDEERKLRHRAESERDRLQGVKDVLVKLGIDPAAGSWETERRLRAGDKDELRRALERMRTLVDAIERQEGLSA